MIPDEKPVELSQEEKDMAIIQHHADILRGHFDSVQIFATRQDDKKKITSNVSTGSGNWYARYGYIRCWLLGQDAYTAEQEKGHGED